MNNPLISVLMPVYNGEKYLREAIESILNQTLTDFEFIIINDGSTDNTEGIILSYYDSRIKYIKNKKNIKLIETLNKGIKVSKGKYIVRMDADDISIPDRFEKQLDFLEKNPEYGLCSGNAISIDTKNKKISKKWWNNNDLPIEWLLLWENPIAHPTVMLRKEILIKYNEYYNKKSLHSEDYDLWCRMALHSKLKRLDDVLLYYRISESSVFRQNVITACSNSIESNKLYLKHFLSIDYNNMHRYFTTFSQAIGEKNVFNIEDIYHWFGIIYKAFIEKYSGSKKIKKCIFLDIKKRITKYFLLLEFKTLLKVFYKNKKNYIFLIILKKIKKKLLYFR